MPTRVRHILVAINDLRHTPRSELRKAGTIARAAGATGLSAKEAERRKAA